ncbi:unnamed protein product [Paramecium pentaurelia]|uniref:Uncharacterized protein n=1 Tax=Paramecium pentaurelia TaxID=43138 RepID=A0A8S1WX72_9CILI|nr:unnamed protein product [Paramecium pentaurelia]
MPLELNNKGQFEYILGIPIYKYGILCEKQQIEEIRTNQMAEEEYIAPMSQIIQDLSIMDTSYQEHIQCMDDNDKQVQNYNKVKASRIIQSKYWMAVAFTNRVQVIQIHFGNKLNQEESKIQLLLNFLRPDAFIYNLVFNQPYPNTLESQQLSIQCSCTWGLGNFKETNKRYVLLIINWGCREYYAFKVMSSNSNIQIIQGGHFYNAIDFATLQTFPLTCKFITNSIFLSFVVNNIDGLISTNLKLMTTSQFEYGVPFTLSQIEKHYNQEKQIQNLSNGQYQPKFNSYVSDNQQKVIISQGILDSIQDGYQISNDIILNFNKLHSNLQITFENGLCNILNGTDLYTIRLKKWDEYLIELSKNEEWDHCFETAFNIHKGYLTLLCDIPENDTQRHKCIQDICGNLGLQFIMTQLIKNQQINNTCIQKVIQFFIKTQNEEQLFDQIETFMESNGYGNIFYDNLKELIKLFHVNIPYQNQIKVLRKFSDMNDKDICQRIIFSIQNIQQFDPKKLIEFCLENDLIEALIYVCSQFNDFLTPYLRILTLITVLSDSHHQNEKSSITSLTIEQLKYSLFGFLQFCFTGQNQQKPELFFTDKQFKSMFKDLFEYLFDFKNVEKLLEIDYKKTLQVFLLVFSERIQDNLRQYINEGKQINISISKTILEGFLPEILNLEQTEIHLQILSKIYVLIKIAEMTYFGKLNNKKEIEKLLQYSYAFSSNIFAICSFRFNSNHILINLLNYMDILRLEESTLFDITWVLRGRVQKDLPDEVIKNEFLDRVMKKLDKSLEGQYMILEELREKAQERKWVCMESCCLIKMKRIPEALYLYISHQDFMISEKVFSVLADQLRQEKQEEFIEDWIFKNLSILGCENSQKLFNLLFTYKRDDIGKVLMELRKIDIVKVDQKIKREQEMHLFTEFLEYLKPRMQIDVSKYL